MDIEERCKEYIEDWEGSSPGYALMITGEWGGGKTFLVKNIIKERNKASNARLAWYISLFGVKNAEDIDDKLFEAAHPFLGDSKKKKWYSVGYNILKSAAKHKYGIEIEKITDSVLKGFKSEGDTPAGCQVLFVDDIERTSMDVKDIFGYFSPIIEGDTRVVFIANERELQKDSEYARIKEKSIGETYELEPNYDEALDSFWKEIDLEQSSSADIRKPQMSDIAKTLAIKNLRIIRQTIHQWKRFFRQLPEEYKSDEVFISNLFEEFVVMSIWYKKGVQTEVTQSINNNFETPNNLGHDESVREMKIFWSSYKERKRNDNTEKLGEADIKESFNTGRITYSLRYAELWPYILMKGKDSDGDWLKEKMRHSYQEHQQHLTAQTKAKRNLERLTKMVFSQSNDCSNDIQELFERSIDEFENGQYTRFDEILQYIQTYLTLMHGKVLPPEYNYGFLATQLKTFLKNHKDKISALPEFDRIQKDQIMKGEDEQVQKCLDDIFDAAKEMTGTSQKQIMENQEKFLKYITKPDRAVTDWVNIPFLCQIDVDKVFEWLGDDLAAHRHLLKFLEYRYRKGFGNDHLHRSDYPDFPYVRSLYEKYNSLCQKLEHQFRLDFRDYNELRAKYGALVAYMKEIIDKNHGND